MFPAITGSGLSVTVTARSACALTVVVAVLELLAGVGSVVAELVVTVSLSTVPGATPAPTLTTSVKTEDPGVRLAMVELTVPVPPTAGVVLDQPPGEVSETKVVPDGSVSLSETEAAALGPLLVTVTV